MEPVTMIAATIIAAGGGIIYREAFRKKPTPASVLPPVQPEPYPEPNPSVGCVDQGIAARAGLANDPNYLHAEIPNFPGALIRINGVFIPIGGDPAEKALANVAKNFIATELSKSGSMVRLYDVRPFRNNEFIAEVHVNDRSLADTLLRQNLAAQWQPGQSNPWKRHEPAPRPAPAQPQPVYGLQPENPQPIPMPVQHPGRRIPGRFPGQQPQPQFYPTVDPLTEYRPERIEEL